MLAMEDWKYSYSKAVVRALRVRFTQSESAVRVTARRPPEAFTRVACFL